MTVQERELSSAVPNILLVHRVHNVHNVLTVHTVHSAGQDDIKVNVTSEILHRLLMILLVVR